MKIHCARFLMILLAAVAIATPLAFTGDAPKFLGVWDAVAMTPNGEMASVITIAEKDGSLDVEMTLEGLEKRVTREKLEGDVLSMTVHHNGVPYDVEVKVEGDTMTGTWSGPDATGTLEGKRQP
jgi:hypothetical protein